MDGHKKYRRIPKIKYYNLQNFSSMGKKKLSVPHVLHKGISTGYM